MINPMSVATQLQDLDTDPAGKEFWQAFSDMIKAGSVPTIENQGHGFCLKINSDNKITMYVSHDTMKVIRVLGGKEEKAILTTDKPTLWTFWSMVMDSF